jgi:hypothetical protein
MFLIEAFPGKGLEISESSTCSGTDVGPDEMRLVVFRGAGGFGADSGVL